MLFIIFDFITLLRILKKVHLKKVGGFYMMATLINTITHCRLY